MHDFSKKIQVFLLLDSADWKNNHIFQNWDHQNFLKMDSLSVFIPLCSGQRGGQKFHGNLGHFRELLTTKYHKIAWLLNTYRPNKMTSLKMSKWRHSLMRILKKCLKNSVKRPKRPFPFRFQFGSNFQPSSLVSDSKFWFGSGLL